MTDFETRQADWLSVDEARRRIMAEVRRAGTERVPLLDAMGRALSTAIIARATLPPWDNSAMDGYAVRGADIRAARPERPVLLSVTGSALAGATPLVSLTTGSAIRIMTGAQIPHGADSVVRVEDTDREAGAPGIVEIRGDRDAGKNVRPMGQDMRIGDVLAEPGASVGVGQVALAAAAGHRDLEVGARPRVAILSSGDELRTPEGWEDVTIGAGIPETNGPTLAAAVLTSDAIPIPPRLARDTPSSVREHVEESLDADVLITSGGASMGEADLFKRVLDDMGFDVVFWRVTLRPGSPISFGLLPRTGRPPLPVFGLPGNPASAFVTFEIFVRPFLLALAGHRHVHRPVLRALAGEPLRSSGNLTHFHRVVLDASDGLKSAYLTGPQGSGLVRSLGRATGLGVVPRGVDRIEIGEPVEVLLLDGSRGSCEEPSYRADHS